MMNNLMEIMGDVAEVAFEVEVKISDAASWTFMFWHLFIRVEFSDCLNLLQNVWLCFINRLDLFLSSVDKFLWYGFLNLMRLNSICSVDIFSILFYMFNNISFLLFVITLLMSASPSMFQVRELDIGTAWLTWIWLFLGCLMLTSMGLLLGMFWLTCRKLW